MPSLSSAGFLVAGQKTDGSKPLMLSALRSKLVVPGCLEIKSRIPILHYGLNCSGMHPWVPDEAAIAYQDGTCRVLPFCDQVFMASLFFSGCLSERPIGELHCCDALLWSICTLGSTSNARCGLSRLSLKD